jgi:hypothetical protein
MDSVAHYRERAAHFRKLAEEDTPFREQFAEFARLYQERADELEKMTEKPAREP